MKKILLSSVVLFVFATSMLMFQMSCSKQAMAQSSGNTTLTKSQILVKYKWQVQEVMSNFNCSNLHFVDGGVNTTGVDYTKFQLVFNANGTGTYQDESGTIYTTQWKFTTTDEHNMECKIFYNNAQVAKYNWNMVEISDSCFQSITAVTVGSNNILQSTRYVPVP